MVSRNRPVVVPEFGQLLRSLRQRRKFSQQEVVRALRERGHAFTQSTLAQYEAGTVSSPDVLVLYGLAEIYRCPPRDLVSLLALSRGIEINAAHDARSLLAEALKLDPREQMALDVVRSLPPISNVAFEFLLTNMAASAEGVADLVTRRQATTDPAVGTLLETVVELQEIATTGTPSNRLPGLTNELRGHTQRLALEREQRQAFADSIHARFFPGEDEQAKTGSFAFRVMTTLLRASTRAANRFNEALVAEAGDSEAADAREWPSYVSVVQAHLPALEADATAIANAWQDAKRLLGTLGNETTTRLAARVESAVTTVTSLAAEMKQMIAEQTASQGHTKKALDNRTEVSFEELQQQRASLVADLERAKRRGIKGQAETIEKLHLPAIDARIAAWHDQTPTAGEQTPPAELSHEENLAAFWRVAKTARTEIEEAMRQIVIADALDAEGLSLSAPNPEAKKKTNERLAAMLAHVDQMLAQATPEDDLPSRRMTQEIAELKEKLEHLLRRREKAADSARASRVKRQSKK